MKGFTKGLVQHRILIIILCIALVVPSVLGMVRTKTKYDLLYYLPQDLETVQGQEILLKDFGKGAFPCWLRRYEPEGPGGYGKRPEGNTACGLRHRVRFTDEGNAARGNHPG